jgi:tetratricopeptide (TPR) repeat protein
MAWALALMGKVVMDEKRDYSQAQETLARSSVMAKEMEDKALIATLGFYNAQILMQRCSLSEALHNLMLALKVAVSLPLPDLMWQLHYQIGKIYASQGDDAKADKAYCACLEVLREITTHIESIPLKQVFIKSKEYLSCTLKGKSVDFALLLTKEKE